MEMLAMNSSKVRLSRRKCLTVVCGYQRWYWENSVFVGFYLQQLTDWWPGCLVDRFCTTDLCISMPHSKKTPVCTRVYWTTVLDSRGWLLHLTLLQVE